MSTRYDAVVIGTGQAGPPLADRLSATGMRVAVVERDRIGGNCVNVGCIPTKAFVASARVAHVARRAAEFGVDVGPVRVDLVRAKARMREISDQSCRGLTAWIQSMENVDLLHGHGRFVGPRAIEVDGEEVAADRIFINVGTRATVPEIPGLADVPFLTIPDLLDLDVLPRHLIVLGGSALGLELGQVYKRFGSEVTIVESGPRLLGHEDLDVSAGVREILEAEGVAVRTGAECLGITARRDGIELRATCNAGEREIFGSHLLVAAGRTPNTDTLGLDAAGVVTDAHGYVEVDDQLRTSARGVWALGDCNGSAALTHTSRNDHELVGANLLDGDSPRVIDRIPGHGLFIDPPLGRVGMTEREARDSGREVLVGKWPMSNVSRARERGETEGFIKILVDAGSEEILGAAILGINGDEVVHSLLDLMYARVPYSVVARAVHIHPTVSELIPTTLQNLVPLE